MQELLLTQIALCEIMRISMKDLTKFYSLIHAAATVARKSISDPAAARKAIAFEERLAKLAAAGGKSAKPRRQRVTT